ncbi:hypothetical protein ACFL02_00690 [Planctomycetota bacterium]
MIYHRIGRLLHLPGADLAERVRRSAQQRRFAVIAEPLALAAVLMIVVGIAFRTDNNPVGTPSPVINPPASAQNTHDRVVTEPAPEKMVIAHQEPTRPDAGGTAETDTQAELAQLRMEIAQLRAEADARMQVVRELLELQKQQAKLAGLEEQLAAIPDPLAEVRRQVEQAAYTMVYHADLKYKQMDLKESAIEDFQRVIQLYPQTRWAAVAHKKLDEIHNNQKGSIL